MNDTRNIKPIIVLGGILAAGLAVVILTEPNDMEGEQQPSILPTVDGSIRAFGNLAPCAIVVFEDNPFPSKKKRSEITQIALHESVTHDPDVLEDEPGERDDATERVLRRRGFGTHFMVGIAPDGQAQVVQHNDLGDILAHTGRPVNDLSVGIEIVNPYYSTRPPWVRSISAPWAHKKSYNLPLPVQVEAVYGLVYSMQLLSERNTPGFAIPRNNWGVVDGDKFRLGKVKINRSTPGLLAHHHYGGHADAAWPALYCALRERGLSPEGAYKTAVHLATGSRGLVDLRGVGRGRNVS